MRNYRAMLRVVAAYNMDRGSGYKLHMLRPFIGLTTKFMVASLPIPRNQEERDIAVSFLNPTATNRAYDGNGNTYPFVGAAVLYAYRDDDKLIYVIVDGAGGWLGLLRNNGVFVHAMGKVVKRLKAFNRPTIMGAEFPNGLNIEVVEDDAFVDEDFPALLADYMASVPEHLRLTAEEYKARLLDGWLVDHARVRRAMLDNAELHSDPLRNKMQGARIMETQVANVRYMDEDHNGKGNMVIGRNMKPGVDLRVSRSSMKAEITSAKFVMAAEPQGPKSQVVLDTQTMINNPKLHTAKDEEEWVKDYIAQAKRDIIAGLAAPSFSSAESRRWKAMKDAGVFTPEGIAAVSGYSILEYLMRGGDYRKSPFMVERLARSRVENLIDGKGNVRIPIPCAVNEQVISVSAARMAGHTITVEVGTIKRIVSIGVHVVNDIDWISMYEDMGGHDLDDFFKLFYRTVGGKKEIIVVRSPNEKGGYRRFAYVEGQPFPTWKKSNGQVISFPEVNDKRWPKMISEALADGSLRYTGLPSKSMPKPEVDVDREYAPEDFIKDVDESLAGGTVGIYINARMLWDLTFPGMRREHLCSLEDAIDTFVQAGAAADRAAITAAASALIQEVVDSGRTIDTYFWTTRKFSRGLEEGTVVNLGDGPVTRAHRMVQRYIDEFVGYREGRVFHPGWAQKWAQANQGAPSDMIHVLGGRQAALIPLNQRGIWDTKRNENYQRAMKLVEAHRRGIGMANVEIEASSADTGDYDTDTTVVNTNFSADRWARLFRPIMEEITSREGLDRHNFVMSLISVVYTRRTKENKISDTMIWNNKRDAEGTPTGPFPYVMDAMRHFGLLADDLTIGEGEKAMNRHFISEWPLSCTNCGTTHIITKALDYQRMSFTALLCKNCREQA